MTIVILTWNGLDYTKRCLETLRANTAFADYRVVVADNGSTDGTIEYLKAQPFVTTISNGSNLGFAKGNNRAIAECDANSDILLLNNDTEIHQSDWIERLQATAYSAADIGVVGCRLVRPEGILQHAGTYMPIETFWGQQVGSGEKDINQYNADRDVEGVVFACVYIKRQALTEIGLLDEDYFSYFEDTDYCFRAMERGYRIVCCGSVTVVHHENVSTRVNGVRHKTMFLRSQKVFRGKWEKQLRNERYNREIGWHSTVNFRTGYAISSRKLACALDHKGVHVAYKYVYGPGTLHPPKEPETAGNYVIDMIRKRNLDSSRIQVVYGQGDVFQSNFGRYKIGFTMLETDRIPAEWVRQANLMDEVWVPSSFNARTFLDSGVSRPIYVIPLGVDPDYFNAGILRYPLTGVYTFLSIFEWGERKMPELLLRAFNDEFRSDEAVALICKTNNEDLRVDVRAAIANLGLEPTGGRIHFSLNQVIPTYQLGSLYRSADCFVLATRGEGWGLPVIEAMACGLPVIATNWSAHCDFMNEGNAYPLEVERLVPAEARCPYYAGFNWAEPSYVHLRRLMRHVFENQAEARARGEKASHDVIRNWTWNHAAQKIVDRVDRIAAQEKAKSQGALSRATY
ncbi:MAG TPA: glycosyltransferase [Bryobacteraceae bacterium]|nr:glycosyltransferase [Bryobacteraceae bacterium]